MKKPLPKDSERPFNKDEMFYSTTDKRGIITSGNSVFQRISGYSQADLIGTPHNVIRHPDMPKVVFKLLWDTIKDDKPICAYVKNMAADGCYYWVLATVFPIKGGYLSVRLKPTTGLVDAARAVYGKMLEEEKKTGMEGAAVVMLDLLGKAGFPDYDSFMTAVLVAEVGERAKTYVQQEGENEPKDSGILHSDQNLMALQSYVTESRSSLAKVFSELAAFSELKTRFSEASSQFQMFFNGLRSLAINMSLSANQLGKAASTLTVISESFQRFSTGIQTELATFFENVKPVQNAIRTVEFSISSTFLQFQMMEFFANEIFAKTNNTENQEDLSADMKEIELLLNVAVSLCKNVNESLTKAQENISRLIVLANDVDLSITTLEIVRQTGSVESAQIPGAADIMAPYLVDIRKLVNALRDPVRGLADAATSLAQRSASIRDQIGSVHIVGQNLQGRLKKKAMEAQVALDAATPQQSAT